MAVRIPYFGIALSECHDHCLLNRLQFCYLEMLCDEKCTNISNPKCDEAMKVPKGEIIGDGNDGTIKGGKSGKDGNIKGGNTIGKDGKSSNDGKTIGKDSKSSNGGNDGSNRKDGKTIGKDSQGGNNIGKDGKIGNETEVKETNGGKFGKRKGMDGKVDVEAKRNIGKTDPDIPISDEELESASSWDLDDDLHQCPS